MKLMKYLPLALVLTVAGVAWGYGASAATKNTDNPPATVETDNCCLTGDCCCPGQGACCDPAAKAASATSGVKYVKKAGAGCCSTGNCCCPGQGACCGVTAATDDGKSCPTATTEKKGCCPK
ncbi:MAG: hypothetical protein U0804_24075 [Gemmataceae bacterium]